MFPLRSGNFRLVLTGFPNYPFGKLYDGYKIRLWQKEKIDGISLIRTALFPSHSRSKIGRIINYLSFAFTSSLVALLKLKNDFDLIYVYHPPITVGLTALILKFFWKVPYIYEVQDIWPDTLKSTGMITNDFIINIIGKFSDLVYRSADRLIVISPGFKKRLIKRGIDSSKINLIYNCCDESNILSQKKNYDLLNELKFSNKFNVVFAGNIGRAQSLESVLGAASLLYKNFPNIQIVFIGDGIELDYIKNHSKKLNLSNILFLDPVPMNEIGEILILANVLLVHLKKDPLFEITIPGKTQTYMALGKPIILGVEGDAANLLNQAKAGIVCEPQNPESISNAIKTAYNMSPDELIKLGNNGREFYNNELCLNVSLKKLNNIFNVFRS